jgi:Anti-sigma-K factor rskA/Sigma-70, region 4
VATFDQLSAEQQAIIELVLKRGQSYEELADMLGMGAPRVQELARDALVTLSPVSAKPVDPDWRGQLADYVLGQQSGPESTATRGHLRRSEPARTWTRSLLDSLDTLYQVEMPQIPDGGGGRERTREKRPLSPEREERAAVAHEPLTPEAEAAVRRRRMIGAGGGAAVVLLLVVLVWPVGLLTGGDDSSGSSGPSTTSKTAANTSVVGQVELKPLQGKTGRGAAVIADRGGQLQLVVQAQLTPSKPKQAYEVWLYNSQGSAKSLGAQVTDKQGNLTGTAQLPTDYKNFKFIDISLEKVDNNTKHSGDSVLRAAIADIQKPAPSEGTGAGTTPQQPAPQTTTPAP